MSVRLPRQYLDQKLSAKIQKDLCLKEKPKFFGAKGKQNWKNKGANKEIVFYLIDEDTNEILLPMIYASKLFNKPIINRIRTYPRINPFALKEGTKLRDYQEEVVRESITNFEARGTTFLNVFCSFGKTFIGCYFSAMFAQKYKIATLVTYHRDSIRSSWIGSFQNLTNAKIYVCDGNQEQPEEDVQVFLCMDTNLTKLSKEIKNKIGHFIIDEADRFCTPGRVEGLLSISPLYITALTATYERDDGFHVMLDLLVGEEKIIKISKKPFFVFKYQTDFMVDPEYGPYGVIFSSIVKQYDEMEARNSLILQLAMDNMEEKILILTKHKAQAANLTNWLNHYLEPYEKSAVMIAGNVKRYNDANIIVGTISKIGVGYDEKEACLDWNGIRINMLILTSSTKKIEQIAGRVFRAEIPVIIDIVDDNKNVKDHWYIRKKWYESRNGIVSEIMDRFCWSQIKDRMISTYLISGPDGFVKREGLIKNHPIKNKVSDLKKEDEEILMQMLLESRK